MVNSFFPIFLEPVELKRTWVELLNFSLQIIVFDCGVISRLWLVFLWVRIWLFIWVILWLRHLFGKEGQFAFKELSDYLVEHFVGVRSYFRNSFCCLFVLEDLIQILWLLPHQIKRVYSLSNTIEYLLILLDEFLHL